MTPAQFAAIEAAVHLLAALGFEPKLEVRIDDERRRRKPPGRLVKAWPGDQVKEALSRATDAAVGMRPDVAVYVDLRVRLEHVPGHFFSILPPMPRPAMKITAKAHGTVLTPTQEPAHDPASESATRRDTAVPAPPAGE